MTDFEDRLTDCPALGRRRRPRRRRPGACRAPPRRRPPPSYGAHLGRRGGRRRGCGRRCGAAGQRDGGRTAPRRRRPDARRDASTPMPAACASSRGATSGHGAGRLGPRRRWSTWCASGGDLGDPVVERPGGVASTSCARARRTATACSSSTAPRLDLAYEPGQIWQYEKGDVETAYPEGCLARLPAGADDGDNIVWVVARRPRRPRGGAGVVRAQHRASTPTAAPRTPSDAGPDRRRGTACGCAATASTTGSSRARCSPGRTPRTPSLPSRRRPRRATGCAPWPSPVPWSW